MYLNKIMIAGIINDQTPRCVLRDILTSSGYDCSDTDLQDCDILSQIYQIQPYYATKKEFDKVATFINSECRSWKIEGIRKAYHHLHNYNPSYFSDSSAKYGLKTQDNPYNLDICLVYKTCVYYNLPINRNTSFEEMITMLKKMSLTPTYDNLSGLFNSLNKKSFYQSHHNMTDCEYIIFSIMGAGINIISSTRIPEEHESLVKYSKSLSKWSPIDPDFRTKFCFNPYFFYVYEFWTPIFNYIYDDAGLQRFVIEEGYSQTSIENLSRVELEEKMQLSRLTSTFYPGRMFGFDNHTTIELNEVSSLSNDETVSYGIYENSGKVYTFRELASWFNSQRKFSIPEEPSNLFSDISLNKLKIIAGKSNNEYAITLKRIMNNVMEYHKSLSNDERVFVSKYKNDEEMISVLQKTLELGMYMRGWKVSSDTYPLSADQTTYTNDQYNQVEENIQKNLINLLTYLDDHPSIKEGFCTIPLMIYQEATGKFQTNSDHNQGLTLYDRIKIVGSAGTENESVYSCVRMSSSWLVSSAYKFLSLLERQPPFQIKQLRYIS